LASTVAWLGLGVFAVGLAGQEAELVAVRRIWDKAPHNAFTDLIRFGNRWYCVFREAQGHVSPDGKIRLISSVDGDQWTSVALLVREGSDLRDPKISVTPDGRLMILAAASWHQPDAKVNRQPMVWFSNDAKNWTDGVEVGEPNVWLWRVTWHNGIGRGVGYRTTKEDRFIRLYETSDGLTYKTLVRNLLDVGEPNEASIIFGRDGVGLCLLRRDGSPNTALLGNARPPYTEWLWKDLEVRIGGPQLIALADGRLVAATRLYDKQTRTALSWLDPPSAALREFLTLPSGGDTSYPGLVWHDGLLWVSYYSSHEEKTSIYLAQVKTSSSGG
jgi:hypothetical protein